MRMFKDARGMDWPLAVDVIGAKRVRDLCGENLLTPLAGDPPLMTRLVIDPILRFDLLHGLLLPEITRRGMTVEQFAESLAGQGLEAALKPLTAEIADFFRQMGRTETVLALEANDDLMTKAFALAAREVEAKTAETLAELDAEALGLGKTSTNTPDSPDSIPTTGP